MRFTGIWKYLTATALAIVALASSARATVIVSWYQDGNDVMISYYGTMGVDSTANGMNNLHAADRYALFNVAGAIGVNSADVVGYVSSITGFAPVNIEAFGGDNFGFDSLSISLIQGPASFTADTVVSGFIRLADTTLAMQGAIFAVDFVAMETIGGAPIVVYTNTIPEPTTAALLTLGAIGMAVMRRRRLAV